MIAITKHNFILRGNHFCEKYTRDFIRAQQSVIIRRGSKNVSNDVYTNNLSCIDYYL